MNGNVYRERILETEVAKFQDTCLGMDIPFVFDDDGAPPHRQHLNIIWRQDRSIEHLDRPSKSPDLCPLENIWSWIQKKVYLRNPIPNSIDELRTAVQDEWRNLPDDVIHANIDSMPNRCQRVIDNLGGPCVY